MTERQLETLKNIKKQLDDFRKEVRFGEWDCVGESVAKASSLLHKAIGEAGERVEKRYVAEFYDWNNKETVEIEFWSNKKAGSYANELDAEFALHSKYREQKRSIMGIRFVNAYRAKI